MDDLHLYYDPSETMYHILDDDDSGVGGEEIPFSAYSTTLYESENPTPADSPSFQTVFVQSISNRGSGSCHDNNDGEDEEENDLEYVDDEQDCDYRPNKTFLSKRGKTRLNKHRHLKTIDVTGMFTPPKKTGARPDSESGTRHYAHKDRTPRTIMKMMEKHRENERVRHHTLNEMMKTICSRIPGYDPHAKETKVVQMQRIIGYECFLENTINNLCEQLGIKKTVLGIPTNFITEALKDKNPEDWFKIGPIEVRGMEDEDSLQECSSVDSSSKYVRKSGATPRYYSKYRQEKISSPTIDSTTDNIIQLFPGRASATSQRSESSLDGSWVSQGFRPIQDSQESGIRTETQSTIGDAVFHDTIDCLFEQELCGEPENLKMVTATFMKDEVIPSSTSVDDSTTEFNLSSPLRYNTNKVFLQSPKPSGIWHQPLSLHRSESTEILGLTEMTSISPEFILETKPRDQSRGVGKLTGPVNSHSTDSNASRLQIVPTTPPSYHAENLSEEPFKAACSWNENLHMSSNEVGFRNKRKRYTPVRTPFQDIANTAKSDETYQDISRDSNKCAKIDTSLRNISNQSNGKESHSNLRKLLTEVEPSKENLIEIKTEDNEENGNCSQKMVRIFKQLGCSIIKDGIKPPFIIISSSNYDENNTAPTRHTIQEEWGETDEFPTRSKTMSTKQSCITTPTTRAEKVEKTFLVAKPPVNDQRKIVLNVSQAPVIGLQSSTNQSLKNNQERQTIQQFQVTEQQLPQAEKPQLIDHRRTTWMNGFMMYSRLNRSKFLSSYPGLQSSQIQRMMGEAWRKMSSQEQMPYREKARKYSQYMKEDGSQDSGNTTSDRLVPSSTTDDLEFIIARL